MLLRLNATLDRNRRMLLIVTALLTATVVTARQRGFDPDHLAVVLAVPLGGAILLTVVLMIGSVGRTPSFLVVESERAFRTPSGGVLPLVGVGHVAALGLLLVYPPDFAHGSFTDRISLPAAVVAFLFYCRMLWHGDAITLTPDGVHADKGRGALAFPWDALDPGNPPIVDGRELELAYTRPELVRTTGLLAGRSSLTISNVPLPTLAAAMRHYLAHPEDRADVGTVAGHERLLRAIAAEPPLPPRVDDDDDDDDDEDTPWTLGGIVKLVTAVVAGFVAYVLVGAWIDTAAGDESAGHFFYHFLGGGIVAAMFGYTFRAIMQYRRDRKS